MEKQTKSGIRKTVLEKRDRLTPVVRTRDSAIIRQRVCRHPTWESAHTVLIYVSFRSEVETMKLIQEGLDQNKRVIVPFIVPDVKELKLSELRAVGDLAPGGVHGILEPAPRLRRPIDPIEVELALVPGAVFDRKGGRIGMGGGYFDKLLAQIPRAHRMGLAYSIQLRVRPLTLESHDIPMNTVVTEKEVIEVPR